jgi:hypothetical protein
MSVREAQQKIDSREFEEWRAVFRITHDPDDRRNAELRSTLWKIAGRALEPRDLLPDKRVYRPPPDHVEIGCKLRAAFGMIAKAQREEKRLREERERGK